MITSNRGDGVGHGGMWRVGDGGAGPSLPRAVSYWIASGAGYSFTCAWCLLGKMKVLQTFPKG